MGFGESVVHWIQRFDYGVFLPMLARLPLVVGINLAKIRGVLQAVLDVDWRSITLKHRYVRHRTFEAMKIINPQVTPLTASFYTLSRFICNSTEEWQACLYDRPVIETISRDSRIESLENLLKNQQKQQGQILISCHYDSFCMGMVLLGMQGIHVNVINTSMIEDPRIHSTVRAFFQHKYRSMESRMHGRMAYYQNEMDYFYQVLDKGETVVIMGDIPGSRSDCYINFLGKRFRMPLGAWHMARKTNSLVGGYMCMRKTATQYQIVTLPPVAINPDSPVETLEPVYRFMESWIRRQPSRWVAADMLPPFEDIR